MAGGQSSTTRKVRPLDQYEVWDQYMLHLVKGGRACDFNPNGQTKPVAKPAKERRHPGMRRGGPMEGKRGRPSKDEFEEFRARLAKMSLDELMDFGFCECGVPLDSHLPLPKPPPLRSWMAERSSRLDMENPTRWDGAPLSRPNVARARRGRGRAISITRRTKNGP